jgi:nucleotide-binding universal stress UspA family protein
VRTWKTVLVGVDGSQGSRKALAWAAAEAADHGAELVVLNVWEHTLPPPAGSVSVSEHYVPESSQRTTEELLQEITEELGESPPVPVQPRRVPRAGARLGQPARRRLRQVSGDRRSLRCQCGDVEGTGSLGWRRPGMRLGDCR